MPEEKESAEERLKRDGWEKMFDATEPRMSEAVELYIELGYEVHLEPVNLVEIDEECKPCIDGEVGEHKTIYIRPKKKE